MPTAEEACAFQDIYSDYMKEEMALRRQTIALSEKALANDGEMIAVGRRAIELNAETAHRGQNRAVLLGFGVMGVALAFLFTDNPYAGAGIITTTLVGVIYALVSQRRQRDDDDEDELEEEDDDGEGADDEHPEATSLPPVP